MEPREMADGCRDVSRAASRRPRNTGLVRPLKIVTEWTDGVPAKRQSKKRRCNGKQDVSEPFRCGRDAKLAEMEKRQFAEEL